MSITIAILALQGAFAEHASMLDRLGAEHFEIRQKKDLERHFDALIIPGGESTVIGKLLRESDILEPVRKRILEGLPVFGTCAGLILLASGFLRRKWIFWIVTLLLALGLLGFLIYLLVMV